MSEIIKRLGIFSFLSKPHNYDDLEYSSERLTQLKNSLNPENNLKVYYNNVVGYFNNTIDKVKSSNGIK